MTKITVVGDPHAKNSNLDKISKLFDIIEELGNPTILLGDLFDTKEVIRGKAFNLVRQRLQNSKLQFVILVGNHDFFNLDCLDHSLQSFKDIHNVFIVDELTTRLFNIEGLAAIPYIHDRDKFKNVIKDLNLNDTVFMHQGFSGFDYGNGYIAEGENEIGEIAHLGKAISGHFHKYQNAGNLTYLGTPFSHSYGESNQDKYIGIFDTDLGKLELIQAFQFFPSHKTIEVDLSKPEQLGRVMVGGFGNNYLRFIVSGSQQDLATYDKALLQTLSTLEVKIIEKSTDEFQADVIIDEASDNLAQFQTWAKDIKNLDVETISLGLKILGAVNAK